MQGGTGLRPVVLGVAPETDLLRTFARRLHAHRHPISSCEIRRDAEFDGRDARATHSLRYWAFDVGYLPFDSILHTLDKLGERCLLAFDHLRVTHQFVKPSLVGQRHHDADEPRGLASARIRA